MLCLPLLPSLPLLSSHTADWFLFHLAGHPVGGRYVGGLVWFPAVSSSSCWWWWWGGGGGAVVGGWSGFGKSTTWCTPPTFGRRWVAMAIQWSDCCVMSVEEQTERGRCVLWGASSSGDVMEHLPDTRFYWLRNWTSSVCALVLKHTKTSGVRQSITRQINIVIYVALIVHMLLVYITARWGEVGWSLQYHTEVGQSFPLERYRFLGLYSGAFSRQIAPFSCSNKSVKTEKESEVLVILNSARLKVKEYYVTVLTYFLIHGIYSIYF